MGESVICSKLNIKGVIDKNAYMKPILLQIWTKVQFSGQNDDNNRNIKNSITIASWDISGVKPWMLRIRKACMLPWQQKYNSNNNISRNTDKCVVYVNTENKKLKEHIP